MSIPLWCLVVAAVLSWAEQSAEALPGSPRRKAPLRRGEDGHIIRGMSWRQGLRRCGSAAVVRLQ